MGEENLQERWEVEAGGQIYAAAFGELPEWIGEGSLLPGDKVRKGNLRWIEASKVPYLIPFFNAKAHGQPMPVVPTVIITKSEPPALAGGRTSDKESSIPPEVVLSAIPSANAGGSGSSPKNTEVCSIHGDRPTAYICGSCSAAFCKACPSSYGGNVKICPDCGAMCKTFAEIREIKAREGQRVAANNEGFGVSDFVDALSHPFKFKPSLIFGALMFMFFTLGQAASAIGGIFMIVSALFCVMLANMLTFGVLANTVENFSQGKLYVDFMPGFENFSIWEDVIHPFFLSIGVYVSSFGPFILVVILGAYFVMNSTSAQMRTFQEEIQRVPGTQYYAPDRTLEQSEEVKKLLGNVNEQNDQRLATQDQIASGNQIPAIDDGAEAEEIMRVMDESRKAQLESIAGKTTGQRNQEYAQMFTEIIKLAAPVVVIGAIALLWGLFYFPAACAVAGYTRSFTAALNPLVGLDTIKRLGFDYVKILSMGFALIIMSAVIGGFLNLVLSPLDLPGMGNLPAKAIGSLCVFYFSVVFSCVLGYALFKAGDRLKLYR